MASKGNWTVVFDDKLVIKNFAEGAVEGVGHVIVDDAFWAQEKFSNIWAIQYGTAVASDEVEYRDETPHTSYADSNLGDISQFTTRWDAANLADLQSNWDDNNIEGETEAEKIARLGARPTSYSS